MKVPLIGVTTSRSISSRGYSQQGVFESYIRAVSQAGACPILIPLGLPGESLREMLPRLDGVLFSGGGDVHPDRYRSEAHPKVNFVDEDRDRVEIELFHDVVARKMPFFGICRGLQVVNVALGGSLYEDLQDQYPVSLKHDCAPQNPPDFLAHFVEIEDDSLIGTILGVREAEVNSMHHQGIRNLAPAVEATAYAPDGLVEAIEMTNYPFGIGVQWHPEWLLGNLGMRTLFRTFVETIVREA